MNVSYVSAPVKLKKTHFFSLDRFSAACLRDKASLFVYVLPLSRGASTKASDFFILPARRCTDTEESKQAKGKIGLTAIFSLVAY